MGMQKVMGIVEPTTVVYFWVFFNGVVLAYDFKVESSTLSHQNP